MRNRAGHHSFLSKVNNRLSTAILLGGLLWSQMAAADTVWLKNGNRIEGEVTTNTSETVAVDIGGIKITFPADQVERIIERSYIPVLSPSPPPEQSEPGAEGSTVAGDAAGEPSKAPARPNEPITPEVLRRVRELTAEFSIEEGRALAQVVNDLVAMGSEAIGEIRAEIPSAPSPVRFNLLAALASISQPDGIDVAQQLIASPDSYTRRRALNFLSSINNPKKVVPILIDSLQDGNLLIRRRAKNALISFAGEDLGDEPGPWQQWLASQPGSSPSPILPK